MGVNDEYEDYEGEGLKDILTGAVSRVKGFFQGVRLDFPPKERAILQNIGNAHIVQITLCRSPIHSMIDKVMNVLSLGKWDFLKNQNNYDKMFHLYMVIKLNNQRMVRIEKNEVIKISLDFSIESDAQFQDISLQGKNITLNELLGNAIQMFGKKRIFIYSPWNENCQRFLLDVLEANQLLTPQAQQFIHQDIEKLVKKLPWYTKLIGQKVTDTAHALDIAIHGQGFNNKI